MRIVVAAGCAVLLLGGCARGASQEELDRVRAEALQQAEEQQRLEELEDRLDRLRQEAQQNKAAAKRAERKAEQAERKAAQNNSNNGNRDSNGNGLSGPMTACGDGVYAGANTSCEFAMNVAGEYGSNYGASSINAYSPVTGQNYVMTCFTWGDGHACTGGNNASVYLP